MTSTYKILITLMYPVIYLYLKYRQSKGKENINPKRFSERFGKASLPRPNGKIIWFHGASLGELNSAMAFMHDTLKKYFNNKILITYSSHNADKIIPNKFKNNPNFICQFIPVDIPFCIERFMNYWKPSVGFFIDSELWPTLLSSAKRHNIPMFLLNARITKKTFKKFSSTLGKKLFNEMISAFNFVFATSKVDEKFLKQLVTPEHHNKIKNFESLKYSAAPLVPNETKLKEIQDMIGDRLRWVAGSTHKTDRAEEHSIFAAHSLVIKQYPEALLILCPRQYNRAEEICIIAKQYNLNIAVRSKGEKITKDTNVYIADTLGEMGIFYSIADIVFIGRSLVNLGGSNPIEPMQLKSVTITGKYYQNFQDIVDEMLEKQVIVGLRNDRQLGEIVLRCFDKNNTEDVKDIINRSYDFVMSKANVKERIFDTIKIILDKKLQ